MAKDTEELEKSQKADKKLKKQDKFKKPNFFVRLGRRLKDTFSELKRVTWPTFPAALKATGVVIAVVAVFLVITTGINYGFVKLLELLVQTA